MDCCFIGTTMKGGCQRAPVPGRNLSFPTMTRPSKTSPSTQSTRADLLRSLWHALPGLLTLGLHHTGWPLWLPFLFLLPALLLAALFDGARLFNPELNTLFTKSLPAGFLREKERKRMSGTFWYLVGVEVVLGVGAIFYRREDEGVRMTACLAIMLLAWADPAASFVGQRFGRLRPKVMNGKSVEGSAAAALVGALIASALLKVPLLHPTAIKAGLISGFSEAINVWGMDDNLVMPILAAVLLRTCMSTRELLAGA